MDKTLRELIDIIHFTENVSAKIHGLLDEAEIYKAVKEEFAQSERYTASILLLTDDDSKLGIAETSIAPDKLQAGEKTAGVRLKGYKLDLNKSSIFGQIVREGETVQVSVSDIIAELFPRPLAYLVSKAMGYEKKPSILTPLKRHGKMIGVLGVSSTELAEHFVPSVRNLAQHISIALELADEHAERRRAEEELRKYRDHLEELVEERTAELKQANEQLQRGIAERKRVQEELCRERDLAEALAEAAAVVSSTLDPNEVLDRILEEVSRVVPNDAANIMLIGGDQARPVRWRGYERFGAGEFISTVVFHLPDVPGLQRMLESKEFIVIPDTDVYPDWVRLPVTDWLRSYAAAPIVVRGEVIGFLNVDSAIPGFFNQDHAETLRAFAGHAAVAIENARLYSAQQQLAQEEGNLLDIAKAITSTLDMTDVLKLVTQRAAQACGADRCTILLLGDEGKTLTPAMSQFAAGSMDKTMWQLFKDTLYPRPLAEVPEAQQVLREDCSLFIPDALASSLPRYWIEPFNVKSLLVVPMISKGQPIGVMGLDQMEEDKGFSAEQVNLAMTIGAQAAIAIENARLYEESNRRLGELSTIQEVSMAATSTINFDQALERAVDTMQRLLDFLVFGFLLVDERTGELHLHPSYRGIDPEVAEKLDLRLGKGITGWVAETGQPLLVPNVSQDSRYLDAIAGIRSEMCVPLKIGERVIGVIDVESDQANAFSEDDLRLLSTLAGQLAVTIENAHLFAETEKKANDLALLLGTSTAISSTLDLDQILETVAHQITTSLVATFCRITLLDETRESLVIRAVSPIRDKTAEDGFRRRYPLAMAPWHRQVVETSEPVVLRQDVPERALSDAERKMALTEGVKSAALIPLIVGGRVLGVITLGEERSWERSPFTKEKVDLCQSIAAQAAVAIENARLYEELQQSFLQTIAALAAAVDAKDPYTGGHSQRTTELAAGIAQELGLGDEEIELIRYASLLHDVGKIGISEQILSKPGPLDEEEWEIIRRHPALGANIVERAASLQKLVPVILHHHEHYDGQGYPEGLRGEDIPLKARILAVADAYEAMTSDRAYRPAMTVEQALATLWEGAGEQWDGQLVNILHKIIREQDYNEVER